jgi:hypothetical protein
MPVSKLKFSPNNEVEAVKTLDHRESGLADEALRSRSSNSNSVRRSQLTGEVRPLFGALSCHCHLVVLAQENRLRASSGCEIKPRCINKITPFAPFLWGPNRGNFTNIRITVCVIRVYWRRGQGKPAIVWKSVSKTQSSTDWKRTRHTTLVSPRRL